MNSSDVHAHVDHAGHRMNLSGTHAGNRFCLDCGVKVGEPNQAEVEAAAAAAVPVVAVVTGDNVRKVADRMRLRAYLTRARTGMNLTRAFTPTVKGFNAEYGFTCRTWSDVEAAAVSLLAGDGGR